MNEKAKEFREKYKVDNSKVIEDFLKQEMIKTRTDKRLSDRQKQERLEAFSETLDNLNTPEEIMRRRSEEVWEK